MGDKYYRINFNIRSSQLRVIGEDGKQVGILPLNEAQNLAKEKGMDLVEIAPTANPPVAKIIDFKKFIYQEEKKERESKRKIKGGEIKGIRITPFIAQGDLEVRVKRTKEFLAQGNKVRLSVRFMGRQLSKREFGYTVAQKFIQALGEAATSEGEPKWMGRDLVVVLAPAKNIPPKGEKNAENENQKISEQPVQVNENR